MMNDRDGEARTEGAMRKVLTAAAILGLISAQPAAAQMQAQGGGGVQTRVVRGGVHGGVSAGSFRQGRQGFRVGGMRHDGFRDDDFRGRWRDRGWRDREWRGRGWRGDGVFWGGGLAYYGGGYDGGDYPPGDNEGGYYEDRYGAERAYDREAYEERSDCGCGEARSSAVCTDSERVWDRDAGRHVIVRRTYGC
jgi:hypothetical protein